MTRLAAAIATASQLIVHAAPSRGAQLEPPQPIQIEEAPFRADEFVLGAADAPVTVVEYLSVTCSHCAAFARDAWPLVRQRLVVSGRVRFVVREMPTAPISVSAAGFLLARCRGETGYWPTVERLLQGQRAVLASGNVDEALRVETSIAGLSDTQARLCLSDPVSLDAVNARRQAGLDLGVDSTPFFLVDGTPLKPGMRLAGRTYAGGELTFDQFAAAVADAERSRARTPANRGVR